MIPEEKSTCCNAGVIVDLKDSGTRFYECTNCHNPCDVIVEAEPPKQA